MLAGRKPRIARFTINYFIPQAVRCEPLSIEFAPGQKNVSVPNFMHIPEKLRPVARQTDGKISLVRLRKWFCVERFNKGMGLPTILVDVAIPGTNLIYASATTDVTYM